MTDTAEYWNDINRGSFRYHPTHASVNACHLSNGSVSHDVDDIDCHYCKALMTEESKSEMAVKQKKVIAKRESSKRKKVSKIKEKLKRQHPNNPDCQCGFVMIKRVGAIGEFYGCSQFPKCKNTKSL